MEIDSYTKQFLKASLKHHVAMHQDTFYYYTENAIGEKQFIIGEYNYKFEQGLLDINELDYYMLYIDSLGKVTGSELPKLPDLSSEEQKRLELLLKNE